MKNLLFNSTIVCNRGLSLLTAYFIFMLMVRAKITGTIYLFFLIWNVFLAAIPYFITAYIRNKQWSTIRFGIAFLLWLAFLPNSFYILTDIMHLEKSHPLTFWLDLVIFASATFTGFVFGIKSILDMEDLLMLRFRRLNTFIFESIISILCGIGVFLGRVLRLNSWDFVFKPTALISSFEDLFLPSSLAFIFSISSFIWLAMTAVRFAYSDRQIKPVGNETRF